MTQLKIDLYADVADLPTMLQTYQEGHVSGFTTNPSLMKQAGVTDYLGYAREVLTTLPALPISFEVFGDDLVTMEKEALKLASLADNVYVKIPILTTQGQLTIPLIQRLSANKIKLNITALTTIEQVEAVTEVLSGLSPTIISVFAGRVADTGVDPLPLMIAARSASHQVPQTKLLWASTRELYNIFQAEGIGADIITVPPGILAKLDTVGQDLNELSLATVRGFQRDIKTLGFSILTPE